MYSRLVSMRWWLAAVFAAIAALTALAVAQVFTSRVEGAFRARAAEIVVGNSVRAASQVAKVKRGGAVLQARVDALARERRLALFAFDAKGRLITTRTSRDVTFGARPEHRRAFRTALGGDREVDVLDAGQTIVVGLPVQDGPAAALVGVASSTDVVHELGIVRNTIVDASLIAVGVGAVGGLLVAILIARRLRRVAAAAETIESGRFEIALQSGFPDEVGRLVATMDRMRVRLRESFGALEAERDRLRLLLEQLQEGVVAVDRDLRVVFANGVARRLLRARLEPESPLPEPWPDVPLRSIVAGLFERGAVVVQARVVPDDDHAYAIAGIPALGRSRMAVLVVSDVSERERRERAEREFVANAAHELRTPIATIATAMDALRSGAKDEEADRERFLAVIDRQATRLGRLVRALLVLARAQTRQESVRLEPVELRPLLEDVAAGLEPRPGVEVEVDCPPGLAVLAQHDLAAQVLANLGSNAAKHVEQGTIALCARPLGHGSVAIEVRDTGSGIDAADQDRVFDRFYSGSGGGGGGREGFGLGLAIVREAVRSLGGVVELESQPGRGTTARVVLAAGASPLPSPALEEVK